MQYVPVQLYAHLKGWSCIDDQFQNSTKIAFTGTVCVQNCEGFAWTEETVIKSFKKHHATMYGES